MRTALAIASLVLLVCSSAHAQDALRGKAVDDCKAELGPRFKQPALTTCVESKMNAARSSGKAGAKTGAACKFSSSGGKC